MSLDFFSAYFFIGVSIMTQKVMGEAHENQDLLFDQMGLEPWQRTTLRVVTILLGALIWPLILGMTYRRK